MRRNGSGQFVPNDEEENDSEPNNGRGHAEPQDQSNTRREIDQPRRQQPNPVRRSLNFQSGAIQPLQDSSPPRASVSSGLQQRKEGTSSALSQQSSRNSATRGPQEQPPPPRISRTNSRDSTSNGGRVSHRQGDELVSFIIPSPPLHTQILCYRRV